MIVIRADHAGPELLAHELLHWLLRCSALDYSGDPGHARAGFWAPYGAVESAIVHALRTGGTR